MINQSYENLTKSQIHKWCVSKITPCPFTIRDTTYMDGSANLRDSNAGLTAIGSLNEDWLAQWAETKHCFFFAKKVAIFRFYTFCEKSCWWCRDSFSSENEKLHFFRERNITKSRMRMCNTIYNSLFTKLLPISRVFTCIRTSTQLLYSIDMNAWMMSCFICFENSRSTSLQNVNSSRAFNSKR